MEISKTKSYFAMNSITRNSGYNASAVLTYNCEDTKYS